VKVSSDVTIADLMKRIKAATTVAEIRLHRAALRRAVRERDVADMAGPPRRIDPGEAKDHPVPKDHEAGSADRQSQPHPARRVIVGADDPGGHGARNDLKARGALRLQSEGSPSIRE
jgi:hypothetical protein